jgi:proline iminopeptidase
MLIVQGFLPECDGHSVYWQSFGNPNGRPTLFLHGGPGCGFEMGYLPLFDLDNIYLITFDQRGCGKSTPTGKLENNTTPDLIGDIERLRMALNISTWTVCGHSWGTTLAVAYALACPQPCQSLRLAAFFGGLQDDQDWSFLGVSKFFPEEIAALHALQQPDDKDLSLDEWLFKNLSSNQTDLAIETAYCLLCLENAGSPFEQKPIFRDAVTSDIINLYKILFFYAKNKFFIDAGLFYRPGALTVPSFLVHGQFDMDCAPAQAYRLKSAFPVVNLQIIRGGAHSVFEGPMFSAFKKIINT